VKNYQICTHCVMDTTDPGIRFNKIGICDHCTDFEQKTLPHWHTDEHGRETLQKIVGNIKNAGRKHDFDCILGLSGGRDSSYMLHTAVRDFGLRPLVFHVDGGWNSEMAVHNIKVLIEKLNLDLFTEVINWEEMRDFQLAWFKSGVPHIDIPQDHAFIATLYKFAEKYKVKYILNGGNLSTECVRYPMEYYYAGTDMVHIRDIIKKFGTVPMATYPFSSVFRHKIYLKYCRGMKVVKPLNYVPYILKDAVQLLRDEYDWKPYPQKHFESRFTRFFEGYWLPTRFNFDVRRVQFSSLILTKQMSRQEALEELKNPPYDLETIQQDFEFVANKLRIGSDELRKYYEQPKKFFWDYKNQQKIIRTGVRLVTALKLDRAGIR
jgi:N-acetyl sugar amidotransferase